MIETARVMEVIRTSPVGMTPIAKAEAVEMIFAQALGSVKERAGLKTDESSPWMAILRLSVPTTIATTSSKTKERMLSSPWMLRINSDFSGLISFTFLDRELA